MHSLASSIGAALAGKDQSKDPSKGDCGKREDKEEEISEAEGAETKDHICSASVAKRLGTHQISVGLWDSIKDKHNQKTDDQNASKSSDSCIVAHCNLGFNEMTSLSSYKDCWLLDIGATSHMTFKKYFFE